MNEPKIIKRQVKWVDEEYCILVTKFDNGAIASERLEAEEAANWRSRLGGF